MSAFYPRAIKRYFFGAWVLVCHFVPIIFHVFLCVTWITKDQLVQTPATPHPYL